MVSNTSLAEGHIHTWKKGNSFTSRDRQHRHRISLMTRTALRADGHGHILLGKG